MIKRTLPYVVAGALALGSLGGCAMNSTIQQRNDNKTYQTATPEIFTKTKQIPSTSYSAGAKGRNVGILLTAINSITDAYRDAGLTEAELSAVDDGDKIIYSNEFIQALKNKYGNDTAGWTYKNFKFEIMGK